MSDHVDEMQELFLEVLRCAESEARHEYISDQYSDQPQTRDALRRMVVEYEQDEEFARSKTATDRVSIKLTETTKFTLDPGGQTGQTIGRYKIREQIGEGGMGTVYVAEQSAPVRRSVALKVIKPGMASIDVVARFEAERQALAMMDHSNIARIHDAGTTDQGQPYFVMELVRGVPITQYCDQYRLSTRDRLELFTAVCFGVQHAHVKGIIHRDLKPSNILVTRIDGVGIPKIIDFGVAKATEQKLTEQTIYTQFAQIIGTPQYMSPEQAEMSGVDVDTRSDVYSLGVILYRLLTGSTPFTQEVVNDSNYDEIRRIIREEEPLRPSMMLSTMNAERLSTLAECHNTESRKFASSIRGDLDWIVIKALDKDRNRRYQSASMLAADIQRYITNETVEARRPSTPYRLRKFFARNRVALITATLVAASLVIGTGVSIWQARNAIIARRAADRGLRVALAAQGKTDLARARSQRLLYASDMKLASDALKVGDVNRVTTLLDRHRPRSGETDLRDFAWQFLNQSVDVKQIWSVHAGSRVYDAARSPDEQMVAIATSLGEVRIYDSDSGDLLRTFVAPHNINDVAWSPDGQRLAIAGSDRLIRVWNFRLPGMVSSLVDCEHDCLQSSSDPTGESEPSLSFPAHLNEVMSVCFTPDGDSIVSGGYDSKVGIWDAWTGKNQKFLEGHEREVVEVCVSPNGELIASASADQHVCIWDRLSGELKFKWRSAAHSNLYSMDFSTDGTCIAAGDNSGGIMLADVQTGQVASTKQLDTVFGIAFVPGQERIATCDRSGVARIWRWSRDATGRLKIASRAESRWQAHQNRARALAVGRKLAITGSRDGTVSGWELPTVVTRQLTESEDFSIANDGSIVVCDRQVYKFDSQVPVAKTAANVSPWNYISSALECPRTAVIDKDGTIVVIDVQSSVEIARWETHREPNDLAISPDGKQVAVADWDERQFVDLYDVSDPRIPIRLPARQCNVIVYSNDGRRIAVGNMDDLIIYDLASRKRIWQLTGHTSSMNDAAFSPDDKRIATVSDDRRLKVWDMGSGMEIGSAQAHLRHANGVSFSHDGRLLATAGEDGIVRIWQTESLLPILDIESGESVKALFTDDDQGLVVQRQDNGTIVYEVDSTADE